MRIIKALFLFLLLIAIGFFFYTADIQSLYPRITKEFAKGEDFIKEVLTPRPLRGPEEERETFLSQKGVIEWTNQRRKEASLSPLQEHPLLQNAAQRKIEDMFEKQYFAHISPLGEGASDLVEEEGYQFIAVGENLALGNYENDAVLVDAWMASPGHRENMLKSSYEEIGVALGRGSFEGRTTWLAVQIFARPLSSCPQPDISLRQTIERNESTLSEMQKKLEAMRSELERDQSPRQRRKVSEYNTLVKEYNALAEQTELIVATYNSQVGAFNQCLKG